MPSTVIRDAAYNAKTHELTITFTSGRKYLYGKVPADIVTALRSASSRGQFFNARIRDRYPYREITRANGG